MLLNHIFYTLKPLIPRRTQIALRRRIAAYKRRKWAHIWPIDPNAGTPPPGWQGWPEGKQFALVLSHDVDTRRGYDNVLKLAELEESMGFRSQFNFVPERYGRISLDLLDELRRRGFGIGVHGLKHDGRLFFSKRIFDRRSVRINEYLHEWKTSGFSSPSMHRNLDWMTALNITYSISTFDTDPFEPQSDGVSTIFPFLVKRNGLRPSAYSSQRFAVENRSSGPCISCQKILAENDDGQPATDHEPLTSDFFIELPYTLPQDSTLFIIFQEKTNEIWKRKLDWIAEKRGMALVNTHPDYMDFGGDGRGGLSYPVQHYIDFLKYVRRRYAARHWHALPSALSELWISSGHHSLSFSLRQPTRTECQEPSHQPPAPKIQHLAPSAQHPAPKTYNRPLNVAMLSYSFYESDGRVRRYAETLARRGDSVDVISLRRQGQGGYNELNGVRIFRVQERVRDEKGKFAYLIRILKFFFRSASLLTCRHLKRHYDLIHVHSVPDFEVFAALLPKLLGTRVILDIHDIVPELYCNKFGISKDSVIFKMLGAVEKISTGFSDHTIISNDLWRDKLIARSVNPGKCTSILNFPDDQLFRTNGLIRKNEKIVLLYPGTLNYHQGLDLAVEALAKIKDLAPEAEFHIYGDGPARQELGSLVSGLGLHRRVFLKDPVPLDEIVAIMASADIGVIPKIDDDFGGEAFSTKTLEFMLLGVPIVLSRTRIDDYYFDASTVRFFESGNVDGLAEAMLALIKNRQLRMDLAQKGLNYAKAQCWAVKKDVYLKLVDSLCKTRLSGSRI